MTIQEIANRLIENNDANQEARVFMDRLLLRVFSSPALVSQMRDLAIVEVDGKTKVQLDFNQLPERTYAEIIRLIGSGEEIKVLTYEKNGAARTGFEVTVPRLSDSAQSRPGSTVSREKLLGIF